MIFRWMVLSVHSNYSGSDFGRFGRKSLRRVNLMNLQKCSQWSPDGNTLRSSQAPGISGQARMKDSVIPKMCTSRMLPHTCHQNWLASLVFSMQGTAELSLDRPHVATATFNSAGLLLALANPLFLLGASICKHCPGHLACHPSLVPPQPVSLAALAFLNNGLLRADPAP